MYTSLWGFHQLNFAEDIFKCCFSNLIRLDSSPIIKKSMLQEAMVCIIIAKDDEIVGMCELVYVPESSMWKMKLKKNPFNEQRDIT